MPKTYPASASLEAYQLLTIKSYNDDNDDKGYRVITQKKQNKIAFQSKADHSRLYAFIYVRMT